MTLSLKFLGAAGTVTGSKYLLTFGERKFLIDAGLFQGERSWREKNWVLPDLKLSEIEAVLLTHAHIDHTGILPRYYASGLNCPVYCTKATKELSEVMLLDSGRLQEEEAQFREESGLTRHKPALPLYTEEQARGSLKLFNQVAVGHKLDLGGGFTAEWRHMGHILGAASIRITAGDKVVVFSGDIGRYSVPILRDPEPQELGDLLLIESTYGDKLHETANALTDLADVINRTTKRGGIVVIPSFAVGRAQLLLYYMKDLIERRLIDDIPVIVDSPMALDATQIYLNNPDCFDAELAKAFAAGARPFNPPKLHFIRDREESKKLNKIDSPMILISASGMLTGGRILHHLKHRVSDPRNTVLVVGYQPPGGRGAWLLGGAPTMRLLGQEVPLRCEVHEISSFSAHADRAELLKWCRSCKGVPRNVAVVHGEPEQARAFCKTLTAELGWGAFVAAYQQELLI